MKKTLVSLFALLAMGSTAFAAETGAPEDPATGTATITTKVIAPLAVDAPETVTLDDVIKGEIRDVTTEFVFTVTGEAGESFSYKLTNTSVEGADNPDLTIPGMTGNIGDTFDGSEDISFTVTKIDATNVVAVGQKTFKYTLSVEYTNY